MTEHLQRALVALAAVDTDDVLAVHVDRSRATLHVRAPVFRVMFAGTSVRRSVSSGGNVHYEGDAHGVTWTSVEIGESSEIVEVVL